MDDKPLKQVKLMPMTDKALNKMIERNNILYPNNKINKQTLVNELILLEAIKRGIDHV